MEGVRFPFEIAQRVGNPAVTINYAWRGVVHVIKIHVPWWSRWIQALEDEKRGMTIFEMDECNFEGFINGI